MLENVPKMQAQNKLTLTLLWGVCSVQCFYLSEKTQNFSIWSDGLPFPKQQRKSFHLAGKAGVFYLLQWSLPLFLLQFRSRGRNRQPVVPQTLVTIKFLGLQCLSFEFSKGSYGISVKTPKTGVWKKPQV